jgi:hypothetical protein
MCCGKTLLSISAWHDTLSDNSRNYRDISADYAAIRWFSWDT